LAAAPRNNAHRLKLVLLSAERCAPAEARATER